MADPTEVDCPRCGGDWWRDLDEQGLPYTCFYCGNGTVKITREMVESFEAYPSIDLNDREVCGP